MMTINQKLPKYQDWFIQKETTEKGLHQYMQMSEGEVPRGWSWVPGAKQ